MHPLGIKRPSNRETRLKAKLRANSLPVDDVACRTRFSRPQDQFSWFWGPFSPICARLRTLLSETARIRGLIRPAAPFNCASVPDERIPTQTCAGISDDQSGSKAYLGVQNHRYGLHGALELLDGRRLDELVNQGGLLQRFGSSISRHVDRQRFFEACNGCASHHRVLGRRRS